MNIPKHVIEALKDARGNEIDLLDRVWVIETAWDWGHDEAAEWLELHDDRYVAALEAIGFSVADEEGELRLYGEEDEAA